MQQAAMTPLSSMDASTARAVYNYLAAERDIAKAKLPAVAPQRFTRLDLCKGIALLRATPKAAAPVAAAKRRRAPAAQRAVRANEDRPAIIRDRALAELARVVAYYNESTGKEMAAEFFEGDNIDGDQWESVGLPLVVIAATIRKEFPKSRIAPGMLRKYVHHVRRAAEIVSRGKPLDPSLEGFAKVVLPERRPKSKKGIIHAKRKRKGRA